MGNLTRRNFIKTTAIASVSLSPIAAVLAEYFGISATEIEDALTRKVEEDPQFHLIDNNLLNIHFYFLNIKKKRKELRPTDPDRESYMIVRLPQQHVSEAGFWQDNWDQGKNDKPFAVLSGFSYLAFQLWPQHKTPDGNCSRPSKRLQFKLENLLDWNDETDFKLITLIEWLDLKHAESFQFGDLVHKCDDFKTKKIWKKASEPSSDVLRRYKSIVLQLFDGNVSTSVSSFVPITFFEVPHEVCLVPVLRGIDSGCGRNIKARFFKNDLAPTFSRKHPIRKYEIWNNQLAYEQTQLVETGSKEPNNQRFVFETPSFRIAGLITDRDPDCPTAQKPCSSDPNKLEKINDILPTLLDKTELTYLTQYAKEENRTEVDFDIKELNGFFFTGLGVVTHLKYDTQRNLPLGIDLIEYEHKITQGRDIFIKVARLGYNTKTGQKYKHVIEGKRKIQTQSTLTNKPPLATSFIELKQYCECIEREISYTDTDSQHWPDPTFISPSQPTDVITNPIKTNACHFRRGPFTALRITDKKRVPIDCLQDEIKFPTVCELEKLPWFWVIREGAHTNPNGSVIQDSQVPIERYVPCHFVVTDWEGTTHEAATPFMFIRASYIGAIANGTDPNASDGAYTNYLKGNYHAATSGNPVRDPLMERKLTYFNGQKVAFTNTPTPPKTKLLTNGNPAPAYDSRTNILETDYLESYFNIKKTDPRISLTEVKYVVFPQVLRARVYLDHIRDITQTKIASIVEYHKDYIEGGFNDPLANGLKNYGKLILNTTEAYVNDKEEQVNRTYNQIKTALQQAKNTLGNLAVPDVIPNAVSLDASGITLPPDLGDRIKNGQATFFEDTSNHIAKLEKLDPRSLLRGKVSEILGGIDLTAILDQLIPQENSPLFELKKLTNELEKIEQKLINSTIYQQILADLRDIKQQVDDAAKTVNEVLANIKAAQQAVNDALHQISSEIPNVDDLDSIIKKLFERYRTGAFEVVLDKIEFDAIENAVSEVRKHVNDFLAQELPILRLDFKAKYDELNTFFDDVKSGLNELPADLQKIGGPTVDAYLRDTLYGLYDSVLKDYAGYTHKVDVLLRTVLDNLEIKVPDVVNGGAVQKIVYYKRVEKQFLFASRSTTSEPAVITWELTDQPDGVNTKQLFDLSPGAGYVQLNKKIENFRALVAGNLQATSNFHSNAVSYLLGRIQVYENDLKRSDLTGVQDEVEAFERDSLIPISKNIREWNDKAEAYRATILDPAKNDAIKRFQELVLKTNAYVDFLRKVDPYFYYREQERLKKDIQDVQRRFFGVLASFFGSVDGVASCPDPPVAYPCDEHPPPFTSITDEIQKCICDYNELRKKLFDYANHQGDPQYVSLLDQYVKGFDARVRCRLRELTTAVLGRIETTEEYKALQAAYDAVKTAKKQLADLQKQYQTVYENYLKLVRSEANDISKPVVKKIQDRIDEWEQQLLNEVDPAVIQDLQTKINEARNIYQLLTSIKQQDLTYKWSTNNFHDVNLGILTFKKGSEPDTQLTVDVRITTHFTPGKFPPAIENVTTLASNQLTNFGVGFFNVLTVSFSEVSFRAESGQSPHFGVKIKDVKFDGAFSFVQEFEKWMANKGLILRIEADRLILGYSLPIPSIQTPSFSFFNMSLNFDIRLYFDNRPMRFGFSFARPDLKFGIAAGIYAGFGFFGLVGEPKRGIVEMDAALEAGAWKGISIGPISGEVKLAFGFRYTRNDAGVRLEGYIVAEGRLSVWIIEVSARIYLGVVSENSYVEGQCTVTYSAKLGFVSKSFSGTFHQKIAGAQSKNNGENSQKLLAHHQKLCAFIKPAISINASPLQLHPGYASFLDKQTEQEPETAPVSRKSWKRFARIM